MEKLIDRLYKRVVDVGHVCVGLDTDVSYLPDKIKGQFSCESDAVLAFNKELIDATKDVAAVYKVQIAYYEALGIKGIDAYMKTLGYLRENNAIVIADVKRGDIAKTAEMYAKAHFSGDFEADFMTVSPFMGMDTLEPFFPYIKEKNKGIFALVSTSNAGASDFEEIMAKDGETVSDKVGAKLQQKAEEFMGDCGYSAIGAVIGCTEKERTLKTRAQLGKSFLLIPGYDVQGGKASDIPDYLDANGNGGVINSSRGILLSHKKPEYAHLDFASAARAEALKMRDAIWSALK